MNKNVVPDHCTVCKVSTENVQCFVPFRKILDLVVPSVGCKMPCSWFARAILLPDPSETQVFSAAEAVRRPAAAANEGKYCSHSFFLCLHSQKGSCSIIYSYQYSQPCKRQRQPPNQKKRPLVAAPVFLFCKLCCAEFCYFGVVRGVGLLLSLLIVLHSLWCFYYRS